LTEVAIVGAGPSGLAAAMFLRERGLSVKVYEGTDRVGGLARSFRWHGFDCDIAPHRLFTRDRRLLHRILELVPMHRHERRSRILIAGKSVRDPVNPVELLLRLPLPVAWELATGYLRRPRLPEDSFEHLARNCFGEGLYRLFFEPYTRKMFGIPPSEISAEWARQKLRISGLRDVLRRNSKVFFRTFHYPKSGGYGSISEALLARVRDAVVFEARVTGLEVENGRVRGLRFEQGGRELAVACDHLVSTLPVTVLGKMLGHPLPLRYRPLTLVYFLVDAGRVMPYHWVYFGDGDVVINRLAEFKNFAASGAPADRSVLVAEVTTGSEDPVRDALSALERYGLVQPAQVLDVKVLHERYGYPIYDRGYEETMGRAAEILGRFTNLHSVGRNAEFRHVEVDETFASALRLADDLAAREGRREP